MVEYSGESLRGAVDGANRTFAVGQAMAPGTTHVFLNGLLLSPGLDTGWVKLNDYAIQLREPPVVGDVVAVGYSAPVAAATFVLPVQASGADIVPLRPGLGTAPLALGGLALMPLALGLQAQAAPGPGLIAANLTPELLPT